MWKQRRNLLFRRLYQLCPLSPHVLEFLCERCCRRPEQDVCNILILELEPRRLTGLQKRP